MPISPHRGFGKISNIVERRFYKLSFLRDKGVFYDIKIRGVGTDNLKVPAKIIFTIFVKSVLKLCINMPSVTEKPEMLRNTLFHILRLTHITFTFRHVDDFVNAANLIRIWQGQHPLLWYKPHL